MSEVWLAVGDSVVGFVRARPGACRGPPDAARSGKGGRARLHSGCACISHGCKQTPRFACATHNHTNSTEADLTPTLHTLTLKSGFYFLQSLRRGARWGPTQRSPMISVSFGSRYWVRYPSQRSEQRSPPHRPILVFLSVFEIGAKTHQKHKRPSVV